MNPSDQLNLRSWLWQLPDRASTLNSVCAASLQNVLDQDRAGRSRAVMGQTRSSARATRRLTNLERLNNVMPGDEILLARVRALMSQAPRVEEKRMFGGTMFMVRGKMCISAGKGRIMCRIDPGLHDKALERDGCRTVEMKGRTYRGYVYVDAYALRTKRRLEYWTRLALDYNGKIKTARSKAR